MKKIIIMILITLLVLPSVYAEDNPSVWAEQEIENAYLKGLIIPEANKDFQNNISRVLFCKLVVNMTEKVVGNSISITIENPFKDTEDEDIIKAYQLGIVKGISEDEFAPNKNITRQEIAAMMMRAARKLDELKAEDFTKNIDVSGFNFSDENLIADWALQDIKELNGLNILKGVGYNKIGPLGTATVEQAILLNLRLYDDFLSEMGSYTNAPPMAKADPVTFSVLENAVLEIQGTQLAYDDGSLKITKIYNESAMSPKNSITTKFGTLTLNKSGVCEYKAKKISEQTISTDKFTLTVSDGEYFTDVNIEISVINNSANHPPKPNGNPVKFKVIESKILAFDAEDIATDTEEIKITKITSKGQTEETDVIETMNGFLTLHLDGRCEYKAKKIYKEFIGIDQFIITVSDGEHSTDILVEISTTHDLLNIPPIAHSDPVLFDAIKDGTLYIKGADLAYDTEELTITKIAKESEASGSTSITTEYGVLTLNKSGICEYTVKKVSSSEIHTDTFIITVSDGEYSTNVKAEITISDN